MRRPLMINSIILTILKTKVFESKAKPVIPQPLAPRNNLNDGILIDLTPPLAAPDTTQNAPLDESLVSLDNDFLTDMFGDPIENNEKAESDLISLN